MGLLDKLVTEKSVTPNITGLALDTKNVIIGDASALLGGLNLGAMKKGKK